MKTLFMLSLCAMLLASASIPLCSAAPVALDFNQQATILSGTVLSPTAAVRQLWLQDGLPNPRVDHGLWHPTNSFPLGLGHSPSSVCLGAIQGRPTAAKMPGLQANYTLRAGMARSPSQARGHFELRHRRYIAI